MNAPSITQQQIYGQLIPFLLTVTGLPQAQVIQGLGNRTAIPTLPPANPAFVVATIVGMRRLRTNIDTWALTGTPAEVSSEMGTEVRVQVDFYGATSQDLAVQFQTLFRDQFGVASIIGGPPPVCVPLYADDARMAPLEDSEDQYEQRWTVEAVMQYNPVTSSPMEFADALTVTAVNVDQKFPPG